MKLVQWTVMLLCGTSSVFVKFVSGRVVLYDWEFEEEAVLADSLSEFFTKLKVRMDQVE